MKLSLLIALVGLVLTGQLQTETQKASDLIVLKFSCGRYEASWARAIRTLRMCSSSVSRPVVTPIALASLAQRNDETIGPGDTQSRTDIDR